MKQTLWSYAAVAAIIGCGGVALAATPTAPGAATPTAASAPAPATPAYGPGRGPGWGPRGGMGYGGMGYGGMGYGGMGGGMGYGGRGYGPMAAYHGAHGPMGAWGAANGACPGWGGARGAWADPYAALDLSAAQRKHIDAIVKKQSDQQWALMSQAHTLMLAPLTTHNAAGIDIDAIMQRAEAMSKLRLQMMRNRLETMQQIDAVLTPKQRAQWDDPRP